MKKIISILLLMLVAIVAYGIISPGNMPVNGQTKDILHALNKQGGKALDKASLVAKDVGYTAQEVGKIALDKGQTAIQMAKNTLGNAGEKAQEGIQVAKNGVNKALETAEKSTQEIAKVLNTETTQINNEPVPIIAVKIHENPNDQISIEKELETAKARFNAKEIETSLESTTKETDKDIKKIVTNTAQKEASSIKTTKNNTIANTDMISSVTFAFNSSKLNNQAIQTLKNIKISPDSKVFVIGHADSVGSKEANEYYSMARANTVKKYLIETGVKAEQINLEYKGADKPLASNNKLVGRRANRRVEIKILN